MIGTTTTRRLTALISAAAILSGTGHLAHARTRHGRLPAEYSGDGRHGENNRSNGPFQDRHGPRVPPHGGRDGFREPELGEQAEGVAEEGDAAGAGGRVKKLIVVG